MEERAGDGRGCPAVSGSPPPPFLYRYNSNGVRYELRVPLRARPPLGGRHYAELAARLVALHRLPCYLEETLRTELEQCARRAATEAADREAEEKMQGGSVFEEGSEIDRTISEWVDSYRENCVEFSSLGEPSAQPPADDPLTFSLAYHTLIHSPALKTLLQLEHTYAMAMSEVCSAWDNARDILAKKHDSAMATAVSELGRSSTDAQINSLMRQHTSEWEACEARWSSELGQLQETQRREYREWVYRVHEDQVEEGAGSRRGGEGRTEASQPQYNLDVSTFAVSSSPPLEESFTIHLGTQMKVMHNIRLLCGDALSLCRHTATVLRGTVVPHPERLQTAMTLCTSKLSAIVLMVDGRVNTLGGMKEAFAKVCRQSTEFQFEDIDVQLREVQECARLASRERRESKFQSMSIGSESSDINLVARSNSSSDFQEGGTTSDSSSLSSGQFLSPGSHSDRRGSGVEFQLGSVMEDGTQTPDGARRASPLLENSSVNLEPGDFYVTRHSNLSQVHVVLHLVSDEAAVHSSSLRSRHPVMVGLKSCLRAAVTHDVHHITIPLLLVHEMQPEMTISWCHRRAELVLKCVKGFMLENTSWESRIIQFLIPPGISDELFHEFCELLPKVYRITTTRNLT